MFSGKGDTRARQQMMMNHTAQHSMNSTTCTQRYSTTALRRTWQSNRQIQRIGTLRPFDRCGFAGRHDGCCSLLRKRANREYKCKNVKQGIYQLVEPQAMDEDVCFGCCVELDGSWTKIDPCGEAGARGLRCTHGRWRDWCADIADEIRRHRAFRSCCTFRDFSSLLLFRVCLSNKAKVAT